MSKQEGSCLYDSWTIEEAGDVGAKFKAKCHAPSGYENCLTKDKEYIIEISPRILPMSPLCKFIGDNDKGGEAHLTRFTKIERIVNEVEDEKRKSE